MSDGDGWGDLELDPTVREVLRVAEGGASESSVYTTLRLARFGLLSVPTPVQARELRTATVGTICELLYAGLLSVDFKRASKLDIDGSTGDLGKLVCEVVNESFTYPEGVQGSKFSMFLTPTGRELLGERSIVERVTMSGQVERQVGTQADTTDAFPTRQRLLESVLLKGLDDDISEVDVYWALHSEIVGESYGGSREIDEQLRWMGMGIVTELLLDGYVDIYTLQQTSDEGDPIHLEEDEVASFPRDERIVRLLTRWLELSPENIGFAGEAFWLWLTPKGRTAAETALSRR